MHARRVVMQITREYGVWRKKLLQRKSAGRIYRNAGWCAARRPTRFPSAPERLEERREPMHATRARLPQKRTRKPAAAKKPSAKKAASQAAASALAQAL